MTARLVGRSGTDRGTRTSFPALRSVPFSWVPQPAAPFGPAGVTEGRRATGPVSRKHCQACHLATRSDGQRPVNAIPIVDAPPNAERSLSSRWPPRRSRYCVGVSRLDRITIDPTICHGKPTVRGLRYPVETLLELLASGMTTDELLDDYPDLEREDILAALEFGALATGMQHPVDISAA